MMFRNIFRYRNLFYVLFFSFIYSENLDHLDNCVSYEASLDRDVYFPNENLFLKFDINIKKGFHIYSVHPNKSLAPTYIEILDTVYFNKIGAISEPVPKKKCDLSFNEYIYYHENNIVLTQPLNIEKKLDSGNYEVKGILNYYACDAKMCIPKFDDFSFNLKVGDGNSRKEHSSDFPTEYIFEEVQQCEESFLDKEINKGLFSFILFSFGMGFIALLTPCVFPMIPITVSYFTKEGEKKGNNPLLSASIYALGIIGTFTLIGFIFTLGESDPGALAADPWINLFIGSLFIFFAFNLFGYYEIQVPAFIRNYSLKNESKGGVVGILFMSLTFTLVSFTCTAAFIGTALVAAQHGSKFWPVIGMISFSTAFAFPFFFLALFPQYLSKLPKSGGWLNSVKVIMGFVEIAAAFKFFSNTDLAWEWGILTRDPVLAIWAFIFLLIGLYSLGKISMPFDSSITSISIRRIIVTTVSFIFSIYLFLGLTDYAKANNKWSGLIESYLPPVIEKYKFIYDDENNPDKENWIVDDLELAYFIAQRDNKPIFIDFTGYACTNCRWMELNIFTLEDVKKILKDNFVLVKLYTDGQKEIHKINKKLEKERFGTVALPYYVILSPDDKELATFPGMDTNKDNFIEFLKEAYRKFDK